MNKTNHFQNCLGVFQGGGCRGSAFVGAYKEAIRRGVFFSQLAGTSSGSIVAVLVAAGATGEKVEEILNELNFKHFLRSPQKSFRCKVNPVLNICSKLFPDYHNIYRYLGIYSSEYIAEWIDEKLRKLLSKTEPVTFKDLIIPTSVVSTDLLTSKVKVWSSFSTPNEEVGKAVRASCSLPFFFQPVENRYVDGGVLSNLPLFVYAERKRIDKILAFELSGENRDLPIRDFLHFLKALANTIIYGSSALHLDLQKNVHLIKIDTGDIKATDFNRMSDERVKFLLNQGEMAAKDFFDNENQHIQKDYQRDDACKDYFQTYNLLALTTNNDISEVLISEYNTKFVYNFFPTLLYWSQLNSKITVILKENNDDEDGPYRQRFLKALGIPVKILQDIPFRGYVFHSRTSEHNSALILDRQIDDNTGSAVFDSKYYYGYEDRQIIKLLKSSFESSCLKELASNIFKPSIETIQHDELFNKLRSVSQYSFSDIRFSVIEVSIKDLILITHIIRGFKYRQINHIFKAYADHKIKLFEPAKLILKDNKETIITPPIVEKHGEKYFVLEGNTRIAYCYKNNIEKVSVVLVEGVRDFLPSSGRYKASEMLITDSELQGSDRYDNFSYGLFRHIEKAARDPKTCLL